MANAEKLSQNNHEREKDNEALEQAGLERREQLRQNLEKGAERPKDNLEEATARALEHAKSKEREVAKKREKRPSSVERRKDGPLSKAERNASYKRTMKQVQRELPLASRTFSKFIHNKAVEKTSEVVGGTIARPNAILAGSISAFIFTLALFIIARHEGYPLTGSETIATFTVGWAVGLLVDYVRLEITGKKF